jgi:hypothetical protein
MHPQKIEAIRKKYHHEWLLIEIDEMDEATTTPLTGKLLAHSKNRDKIYKKQLEYKKELICLCFSEDKLPKGYALAF